MLLDSFYIIYQYVSINTMLRLSSVNKEARYILFNPIDKKIKLRLLKSPLAKYTYCKINLKKISKKDVTDILDNSCKYNLLFIYRKIINLNIVGIKYILSSAILYHCKPIIIYLLRYNIIKSTYRNNFLFKWSCKNGYHEIVTLLIYHKKIDPSIENNIGLCLSSTYGHYKIVKLLLYDNRVCVNRYVINGVSKRNFKILRLLNYVKKIEK